MSAGRGIVFKVVLAHGCILAHGCTYNSLPLGGRMVLIKEDIFVYFPILYSGLDHTQDESTEFLFSDFYTSNQCGVLFTAHQLIHTRLSTR